MIKTCIRFLFAFLVTFNVVGQQAKIREVDTVGILKSHVQDLDRSRFAKGYYSPADGGGGLFTFTNTISATNLGTRFQVTGQNYSWERVHEGMVNVRWFGAKGDGFTDDSVAIQACLDYCHTNGFTTFISAGTFAVGTTLNVKDNAKVIGAGKRSILYGLGTTVTMSIQTRTNILLRDFQFAGLSENQLKLTTVTGITVEDMEISGAVLTLGAQTAGLHFEGVNNGTFVNMTFSGNGLGQDSAGFDYNVVGSTDGSFSTNITFIHPVIKNNNAKFGIAFYCARDHWVYGADVDMGFIGSTNNASGYGLVSYSTAANLANINVNFIGCNVRNTYGTGIYFVNTAGGSVVAPKLFSVAQTQTDFILPVGGISVNASSRILLDSISLTNSGINSSVVFNDTTNCSVIGGTIDGIGTNHWGVEFRGENFGSTVKGLSISTSVNMNRHGIGTSFGGAYITGGDIEGNTINNCYEGITLLVGSSNNIVRGNRVYANGNIGVADFGLNDVIDNNIVAGGVLGIYAAGTNGLILPNIVLSQTTGLLLSGSGYHVDLLGRYTDNTIPVSDPGGNITKTLTSGITPSVKDSQIYLLNYAVPTTITGFIDAIIGMRRTFYSANTNVTIQNNSTTLLDGAGDFNLKSGDMLTLELDTGSIWKQVGKSISTNWMWYNRSTEQLNVNSPLFDYNTYYQQVAASTTVWPEEHVITTNSLGTELIARWRATNNVTGFAITTSSDKTNYLFTFDGLIYQFPKTNSVIGQVLASDGGNPQHFYWTNIGGGSVYTFNPSQFGSSGGVVWLTNGALTTNLVLKGAVTSPVQDVPGISIDAATGTEFSKQLASNTTLGIVNMVDGQSVSLTVTNTTYTLGFTNAITWISGVTPVIDTNAVNVFHFFRSGSRIFGSDPEQVANGNVSAIASLAGTGVVVKTNTTSFATFDPLPIRYGGTGTNFFSSLSSGNIVFYDITKDAFDSDAQFLYSKPSQTLFLTRTVPNGQPQLDIFEGSGAVPIMEFYANKIEEGNDDLTLNTVSGSNILAKVSGVTTLKVSQDASVIAGAGSTVTTRTNQFFYLPTTAGTPTGVPVVEAGHVAIDYDTSGKHLYVYQGGWNLIDSGGGITGLANPATSIGLTVNNGSATTAMRSDGAPALSQSIAPTWSALHIFGSDLAVRTATNLLTASGADLIYTNAGSLKFKVQNANGSSFMDNDTSGQSAHFQGGTLSATFANANGRGIAAFDTALVPTANNTIDLGSSGSLRWKNFALDGRIIWNGATNSLYDLWGGGSPEGVVTARLGSLYRDAINGIIYVKNDGVLATGWLALSTGTGGGSGSGGNPTALVGLAAINGVSTNFMRSDAAPALNEAITPTWSDLHIWLKNGGNAAIFKTDQIPANNTDHQPSPYTVWTANIWDGAAPILEGTTIRTTGINGVDSVFVQELAAGATTLELSSLGDVVIGQETNLLTTANNGFIFIPRTTGTPTGTPYAFYGKTPLVYNTATDSIFAYNAGVWHNLAGAGGGGGGGSGSTNWIDTAGTNANLRGEAFVNKITSTNGFAVPSGGLYTATSATMKNDGGVVTVLNNSSTAASSLNLQGGTGAQTVLSFSPGTTVAGSFDTNKVFNAYYGSKSDSSVVTNSSTIGAGTSGVFARVGGVLFVNISNIANVGGGEDDLQSYPISGNTLAVDKDVIRFRCAGGFASNSNTKEVKVYFGSTVIFATGPTVFTAGLSWVVDAEIVRVGATSQVANVRWSSDATNFSSGASITLPSETLSGTVVFKVTGTGLTTLDIYQRTEVVEFLPAP